MTSYEVAIVSMRKDFKMTNDKIDDIDDTDESDFDSQFDYREYFEKMRNEFWSSFFYALGEAHSKLISNSETKPIIQEDFRLLKEGTHSSKEVNLENIIDKTKNESSLILVQQIVLRIIYRLESTKNILQSFGFALEKISEDIDNAVEEVRVTAIQNQIQTATSLTLVMANIAAQILRDSRQSIEFVKYGIEYVDGEFRDFDYDDDDTE